MRHEGEVTEGEPKLVNVSLISSLVHHGFTPLDDEFMWIMNNPTILHNYQELDEYRLRWENS